MNVKLTHIVQFILTVLVISAAAVAKNYPDYGTLAMMIGTIAAGANLNLALLSSSIVDPTPAQSASKEVAAAIVNAAKTIALIAFAGAALHGLTGCGGTVNPAAIPGDVVQLDAAACKLVEDLGGPTIVYLCPTSSGGTGKVSVKRTEAAALHLAPASSAR